MVMINFEMPKEVQTESDRLVKEGVFKSREQIVKVALFNFFSSFNVPEFTRESRLNKMKIRAQYLDKAKGNEKKAIELEIKDIKKLQRSMSL